MEQEEYTSYPITLTRLNRVRVVVVGGGQVAERKVLDLLAGGAKPILVSPTLTPVLSQLAAQDQIIYTARQYQAGDLAGACLVFAATNDPAVNHAVIMESQQLGALANSVDQPAASDFHTVAAIRRGDLLLTISTAGAAPVVAAKIRRDLEQTYNEAYSDLLLLLRRIRSGAVRQLAPAQRHYFWQQLSIDRILALIQVGAIDEAEAYIAEQIQQASIWQVID